jgi:hypothetical protein
MHGQTLTLCGFVNVWTRIVCRRYGAGPLVIPQVVLTYTLYCGIVVHVGCLREKLQSDDRAERPGASLTSKPPFDSKNPGFQSKQTKVP